MATKTAIKTTKNLPLGSISLDKLKEAASFFSNGNKFKPDLSYGTAQLINGKPPFAGLFIDQKDLPKAGWLGMPLPSGVKEESKIWFGLEREKKTGLLFNTLRFILIDQSPRFVESTADGEKAFKEAQAFQQQGKEYNPYHLQLGTKNSLVAIYCDADGNYNDPVTNIPYGGSELYEAIKPLNPEDKSLAGLRTFYLIYLVNEEGELLHTKPLCLSVKGLAAVNFGEALEETGKALLQAIGEEMGDTKMQSAVLTRDSYKDFIFTMELEGGSEGKNGNWITRIVKDDEGILQVGADFITDIALRNKLQTTYEANDGFQWKFAASMAASFNYHKLEGALGDLALPGTIDVTSVMNIENNAGEEFDF